MKNYHLARIQSGEWHLTREGSEHILGVFETKEFAVRKSADYVRRRAGTLQVHQADGSVDSLFWDPQPGVSEK